jgi:hypothetical protein
MESPPLGGAHRHRSLRPQKKSGALDVCLLPRMARPCILFASERKQSNGTGVGPSPADKGLENILCERSITREMTSHIWSDIQRGPLKQNTGLTMEQRLRAREAVHGGSWAHYLKKRTSQCMGCRSSAYGYIYTTSRGLGGACTAATGPDICRSRSSTIHLIPVAAGHAVVCNSSTPSMCSSSTFWTFWCRNSNTSRRLHETATALYLEKYLIPISAEATSVSFLLHGICTAAAQPHGVAL